MMSLIWEPPMSKKVISYQEQVCIKWPCTTCICLIQNSWRVLDEGIVDVGVVACGVEYAGVVEEAGRIAVTGQIDEALRLLLRNNEEQLRRERFERHIGRREEWYQVR